MVLIKNQSTLLSTIKIIVKVLLFNNVGWNIPHHHHSSRQNEALGFNNNKLIATRKSRFVSFSGSSIRDGVSDNPINSHNKNEFDTNFVVDAYNVAVDDDGNTFETLSELLLQLLEVDDNNDYSTNKTITTSSEAKHLSQKLQRQKELLLSRLDNNNNNNSNYYRVLNIHRTYVAESTMAGRGLFACRDYPKGTLLTCYPGDALVDLTTGEITWGSHTSSTSTLRNTDNYINHDYMLRAIREDWGIIAFPDLQEVTVDDIDDGTDMYDNNFKASSTYLGHFANDGATSLPVQEKELAMYVIESADKANAMHQECQGCNMVTIATRDIKAGEEIFVTYGPEYWSEQPSYQSSTSLSSSLSSSSSSETMTKTKTTTTTTEITSSSTGGKGFG